MSRMVGRFRSRSGIVLPVPDHTKILDLDGSVSLTFHCGELPADGAISAADHESNGYFWEGMVQYLAPHLAEQLEPRSLGLSWSR